MLRSPLRRRRGDEVSGDFVFILQVELGHTVHQRALCCSSRHACRDKMASIAWVCAAACPAITNHQHLQLVVIAPQQQEPQAVATMLVLVTRGSSGTISSFCCCCLAALLLPPPSFPLYVFVTGSFFCPGEAGSCISADMFACASRPLFQAPLLLYQLAADPI